MSDMKNITARHFQHTFSKTTDSLKPGQSLTITKRGKPLGVFTKLPNRPIKTPDFLANLKKLGHSEKLGDQILKEFYDSLS
jgi:antitoxin (DNA-binding transcriptional repressor) of toxin-antitoxin stability system